MSSYSYTSGTSCSALGMTTAQETDGTYGDYETGLASAPTVRIFTLSATGGHIYVKTRPRNIARMICVKY
jgi:hypothetical protein